MNIFLLEHPRQIPRAFRNDIANTPLASSLITASLRGMLEAKGHKVTVAEGFLGHKSYRQLGTEILACRPQLLGVHLIYQWEEQKELFGFLQDIKKELPLRIVAYGYYPTFAYRQLIEAHPGLFNIVAGEPEPAFAALAEGRPLPEIPGLKFFDDWDELRSNPRQPLNDLDLLAHPARSPELLTLRELNVEGSRGCYNQCSFCHISPYYGSNCSWRGHSIPYICEEIEELIAVTGKRRFYFTDPNFFGPGKNGQQRAIKLAKELKHYHIRFGIEARVNDIQEESLAALAAAGLDEMLIGLESGSDEGLRRLHKNTTVAQNEKALALLKAAGIKTHIGFIMFEPGSTLGDIRANIEFLLRNDLLNDLATTVNLLYHHQIVLKGTAAYEVMAAWEEEAYHIQPPYQNREICLLAYLMRRLSNCVFFYLAPIWQQTDISFNIKEAGAKINTILVNTFLLCFNQLEKDLLYSERDIKELAAATEMDIAAAARELYQEASFPDPESSFWAI